MNSVMRLLSVEVKNLRNIESAELPLAEHATVVVGANGQGKTNLLEAVYLLATLRPLRASRYADLICFGQARARVVGRYLLGGAERAIAVEVDEQGRAAFVDGKPVKTLTDYFGGVSVVAFTPDDLAVIKGGPEGRRRLLDRAVFNRFPSHLEVVRDYQRSLRQRNRLLKDGAPLVLLEAHSETLAKSGARLMVHRRELVAELADKVATSFEAIAPGDGGMTLRYAPVGIAEDALIDENRAQRALFELLHQRVARDVERRFTSAGPHADDLEIELSGRPARAFASQGQQRAIVLALKIGEIENLRIRIGRPPLLLLDDVSSELDPARNAFLMNYLRASGLQVVLTTTDDQLVQQAAGQDTRYFSVQKGVFQARPSSAHAKSHHPA